MKYCLASPVRKLIPIAAAGRGADEKCSSPAHATCPVYRMRSREGTADGPCPCLGESLMQYCGAAAIAKMVPYSESVLSRCGNNGYRYCELYLAMANPGAAEPEVDGIPLPEGLRYSANHMWLDVDEEGFCHAGMDAFLSRALGLAERVSYVWQTGEHRVTAVVTVNGVDHDVVFPNPFRLTACNLYLRSDPAPLANNPYRSGWLFEGVATPETTKDLFQGAAARDWMEREQHRMNEFLQQQRDPGGQFAADGGVSVSGLSQLLNREQMRALFHEFFSPLRGKRD